MQIYPTLKVSSVINIDISDFNIIAHGHRYNLQEIISEKIV